MDVLDTTLKSVNLDSIFLHQSRIDEELRNVFTLIALELNDLSKFNVFNDGTITAEFLFKVFENLVIIVVLMEALHRRQTLPSVALLYAHVHIVLSSRSWIFDVCLLEWVCAPNAPSNQIPVLCVNPTN
eukprot:TRINITY_DN5279_c0_g1_i1.p1 TRINITY_DN5279_c0_g1~~TRINITY_DN5279_c0_g1_i1.p1  ORF type:complete len:129 (-),score=0.06 TRINITY_DN5279_c0_g1_i1:214-600(-)